VNSTRIFGASVALAAAIALSACAGESTPSTSPSASTSESPATPVIAPVTMDSNDLQAATVELVVGQVLNIDTGDLAVDSYSAEVSDDAVAEFVQGREEGGAVFNPGFEAIAEGSTEVTMTNADGGIQPLQFTIEVTAR
jgi:ABC-type enterochelin transport system substrate-binding protein